MGLLKEFALVCQTEEAAEMQAVFAAAVGT